jgi:hypothetical protein
MLGVKMGFVSMLNEAPSPVGEVKKIDKVNEFVVELNKEWDAVKPKSGFLGKITGNIQLVNVSKFLMFAVDALIVLVENLITSGADKKATVLDAMASVYDFVTKNSLPLWLIPFAGGIKTFVIYTVISLFIDYTISKYKNGSWKKE